MKKLPWWVRLFMWAIGAEHSELLGGGNMPAPRPVLPPPSVAIERRVLREQLGQLDWYLRLALDPHVVRVPGGFLQQIDLRWPQ